MPDKRLQTVSVPIGVSITHTHNTYIYVGIHPFRLLGTEASLSGCFFAPLKMIDEAKSCRLKIGVYFDIADGVATMYLYIAYTMYIKIELITHQLIIE